MTQGTIAFMRACACMRVCVEVRRLSASRDRWAAAAAGAAALCPVRYAHAHVSTDAAPEIDWRCDVNLGRGVGTRSRREEATSMTLCQSMKCFSVGF